MSRPSRQAELVTVPAADGSALDGAWYPAEGVSTAVLHVHGKGGNFYTGTGRFLPQWDRSSKFSHLSVNMRCHDLGYTASGVDHPDPHEGVVAVGGGMWERIVDGSDDLAAAVAWLRERSAAHVVVAGHSSGGFYAAQAQASGVDIDAIALLSPVLSHKRHLDVWFPDGTLDAALEHASELAEAGEGHQLIAVPTWYYAISAASLLERVAEPDNQLALHLRRCSVPVLMVCGALEQRVAAWTAVMAEVDVAGSEIVVIPDVDHSYRGSEHLVAAAVADFAGAIGAP